MKYEFELARSFMRSSTGKKRFHPHIVLSIVGIAVGVSFLVFALSVYDGYVKKMETIIFSFYPQITLQSVPEENDSFEDDFLLEEEDRTEDCRNVCDGRMVLEDLTLNQKPKLSQQFDLNKLNQLKDLLSTIKGIKQVSPIILDEKDFNIQFSNNPRLKSWSGPLRILGVESIDGNFVPEINRTITDPKVLKKLHDPTENTILLSTELYEIFFGSSPNSPNGQYETKYISLTNTSNLAAEPIRVSVSGRFKLGMHKISQNMVVTSIKTAQRLFLMPDQVSFVGVSLNDPFAAELIAEEISSVTADHGIQNYHWMAVAADMFNSLSFYRIIIFIVLSMSILLTTFNIYTTLNIMILERKKQIGTLMSMGMKKFSLYKIFLIISQKEALIGIVSGISIGVFLGWRFSDYLNRSLAQFIVIQNAGAVLYWETVVSILTFICLLAGMTAIIATRKGANLDPVDALRSE